jgi:hypothetical protein
MKRFFLLAGLAALAPFASLQAQSLPAGSTVVPPTDTILMPVTNVETVVEAPKWEKKGWFRKRTDPAVCQASANSCVGHGCEAGKHFSAGECWDKFRGWFCFRGDRGCYLPCFTATPYRPPLYNWFPCDSGCASNCGSCGQAGCGGPPITYYYPTKQHPAPPTPKVELRGPQAPNPNAAAPMGTQPVASTPNPIAPGFHFAKAEPIGVEKKAPLKLPSTMMKDAVTQTPANSVQPVSADGSAWQPNNMALPGNWTREMKEVPATWKSAAEQR